MKRFTIALALLAIAMVAGGIAWRVAQPPYEPIYKGKPLSFWLDAYATARVSKSSSVGQASRAARVFESERQMQAALSQAGTNAIPTYLRFLRMKDSPLKIKLMDLVQRQHIIKIGYIPADCRDAIALQGFFILGADARTAVPELIEIANQNISPESQSFALYALASIGPAAKEAVPSLLRWATTNDVAGQALLRIDPEAAAKAGVNYSGLTRRPPEPRMPLAPWFN